MFVKLRDLDHDDSFDYCVVGSGPAGVTCALGLAQAGKRVLVLEGGGQKFSEESQTLYEGQVIGDTYFDLSVARLRYLGGSSNHWGGWCRMLDQIDFQAKDAFPEARWPIEKSDLDAYMQRASDILEIGPFEPDLELSGGMLRKIDLELSPPVRFGEKYYDRLKADKRIAVAFHANLVGLETNGQAITNAEVIDFADKRQRVRARRYILAAGGIENNRLLLWCNQQTNGQIVKQSRVLGRYWLEHPHFTVGEGILMRDVFTDRTRYILIAPTETAIRRNGTLNCALRILPRYEGAKQMIADIACVAPDLAKSFFKMLGKRLICATQIRAAWEQEPRAANRIELAPELDRLGVPRPLLYWQKSERDLDTIRKTAQLLGEYIAEKDIGRMRLKPWVTGDAPYPENDELAGNHHMGGTRMADHPEKGIVDRNCKVFGQDNLYITGSSVFPSAGHANPTLTIVQLALRLVEHLRGLD